MKRFIVPILFLIFLCVPLFSGPFGIEMGWSHEECIKNGVQLDDDPYISSGVSSFFAVPPKAHPDFTTYIIRIDEEYGVYEINGYSNPIATSSDGAKLKAKFITLENQISKTYGESIHVNILNEGSIWDESSDWMMALQLNERTFVSMWFGEQGNPIMIISLTAKAKSSYEGSLSIFYGSDKSLKVLDKINANEASFL
jgi:hypothetical protein